MGFFEHVVISPFQRGPYMAIPHFRTQVDGWVTCSLIFDTNSAGSRSGAFHPRGETTDRTTTGTDAITGTRWFFRGSEKSWVLIPWSKFKLTGKQ